MEATYDIVRGRSKLRLIHSRGGGSMSVSECRRGGEGARITLPFSDYKSQGEAWGESAFRE